MARCSWLTALVLASGCTVGLPDGPMDPVDEEPPVQPPQPTTPTLQSIAGGSFRPIAPYTNLAGRALMVRGLDGRTELSVAISGMTAGTAYTGHLHNQPCQYGLGGGHYKIDPAVLEVIESNELWLKGMATDKGVYYSKSVFQHVTRGEALSFVIHDPTNGNKMACADLVESELAMIESGDLVKPLATATAADMTITGLLGGKRTATGTQYTLTLSGLDRAAVGYETHIHAQPCEVTAGGGHYKIDPSVATTIEANEIWLPVTNYATTGMAMATVTTTHAARTDAQSLVLHRVIDDLTKPKVACANLTRKTAADVHKSTGIAQLLSAGSSMPITGTAIMTRKLTGVTEVAIVMTGLAPDTTYEAHVHDQVCSAASGGAHFKFDRAIGEVIADNEIWFRLTADAEGAAHDSTWVAKTAGADAASVVVHGTDGARLACFDLQ